MTSITTVTPNPAWDVTYEVAALTPGEVHRVQRVHRRLGGKGVNVARVLAGLGEPVTAVVLGTESLAEETQSLADETLTDGAFWLTVVPGVGRLRQTLVVHAVDGVTTSLWEPGSPAAPGADRELTAAALASLDGDGAGGLVVSGSLPPGLDPRLPARLAAAAIERGVPAVVDADGDALAHAALVPGVIITPNADELGRLTGVRPACAAEAVTAAAGLLAGGPRAVIVTLGGDGLVAVTADGGWYGRLPQPLSGNPTGAGDAVVAALIRNLAATGPSWPDLVREAVALSAAAVLSPVAGEVSRDRYAELLDVPEVTEAPLA